MFGPLVTTLIKALGFAGEVSWGGEIHRQQLLSPPGKTREMTTHSWSVGFPAGMEVKTLDSCIPALWAEDKTLLVGLCLAGILLVCVF